MKIVETLICEKSFIFFFELYLTVTIPYFVIIALLRNTSLQYLTHFATPTLICINKLKELFGTIFISITFTSFDRAKFLKEL